MKLHVPIATSIALLAPLALWAQDPSPSATPDAVKGITAKELGGHMRFLASDLMKGRDTASPEIRLAGEYLASRLFAAGAEPCGDAGPSGRTFFQAFPLEYVTPKPEGITFSLILEKDGSRQVIPYTLGSDFTIFPRGVAPGDVEAQVVFGGKDRGTEEEIAEFAKLGLKNRFVLLYGAQGFGGGRRGGPGAATLSKSDEARKQGALGILTVQPPDTATTTAPARPAPPLYNQMIRMPSMTLGPAPASVPVLTLMNPVRDKIFEAINAKTGPEKPIALEGVRARFTFAADKEVKNDRNVIGIFPGSDPEKKKEVVIFSAHYDHVGTDEKGEIFNGSDDNASGTSSLLEIAEAFGEGPRPARSVAFLWVSGEEKGLLGSEWFADHISLPEGYTIVADINLDMVSRNDNKKIGITPSPKHPDYSTLITSAQETCKAEGLEAVFDADQYYARTDSYNFAKKGIPVIFFFCGVHEDYHKPTDDVEKADFDKASKVARAAYRLGYQFANAADLPKKIKPEEPKAAEAKTKATTH